MYVCGDEIMARCPRCNSTLSLEYDDEGYACDGWCDICSWPKEIVECEACSQYMIEDELDYEVKVDGEDILVCEGCYLDIDEEE